MPPEIPAAVLAATRGTVIRAQPTIDEPTVRHEIWHAVIESHVPRDVPDWFHEGLAIEMERGCAGVRGTIGRSRTRPPSDCALWRKKKCSRGPGGKPAPAEYSGQ